MISILVVDDEERMRNLLGLYLEREGFQVMQAADGEEALSKAREAQLIILDWMLPKLDGIEVCRRLRGTGYRSPILFLTAKGEEFDRLKGFDVGGDDYVVKPFSPLEVVARVKALLKRSGNDMPSAIITRGALTIDEGARRVEWEGKSIALTPKEFDLLLLLARRPGRVYSREQILEQVWGYHFFGSLRTVDTHIKTLREKLSGAPFIRTVWGVGYAFEDGETPMGQVKPCDSPSV